MTETKPQPCPDCGTLMVVVLPVIPASDETFYKCPGCGIVWSSVTIKLVYYLMGIDKPKEEPK